MRTIMLDNKSIVMYDAIEDLPMIRFHKFNKALLIDAGIGSDLTDFDKHIEKITRYINSKTPELANIELDNMRQNVFFIQENISPKYLAFAALVKSIDGIEYNDLSDEGLRKIVDMFANVPCNELTAQFEAVKKKIDDELLMYFPVSFDDASVKEYFDILKRRTVLMLKGVIHGETDQAKGEIDSITTELLLYSKPCKFTGQDNTEVAYDKQFDKMCLIISQNLHVVDPKKYTVMEYYNAFEYIREIMKERQKANKPK